MLVSLSFHVFCFSSLIFFVPISERRRKNTQHILNRHVYRMQMSSHLKLYEKLFLQRGFQYAIWIFSMRCCFELVCIGNMNMNMNINSTTMFCSCFFPHSVDICLNRSGRFEKMILNHLTSRWYHRSISFYLLNSPYHFIIFWTPFVFIAFECTSEIFMSEFFIRIRFHIILTATIGRRVRKRLEF